MTQIYDRIAAAIAAVKTQGGVPDTLWLPPAEWEAVRLRLVAEAPTADTKAAFLRNNRIMDVAFFEDRGLGAVARLEWHREGATKTLTHPL